MKHLIGKVVSDKMKETVVVEYLWFVKHPMYSKQMRRTRKFHAHNTVGAKTGDMVRIVSIQPMSKTKHWKVEAVV